MGIATSRSSCDVSMSGVLARLAQAKHSAIASEPKEGSRSAGDEQ
jgi:hypothetical protein